jgi:hypothetical protein
VIFVGLMAQRFNGRGELRAIKVVIDPDKSLQERALRKREMLNSLLGESLQGRGLGEQQSRLLAEATVSALYAAVDQWLDNDNDASIDELALRARRPSQRPRRHRHGAARAITRGGAPDRCGVDVWAPPSAPKRPPCPPCWSQARQVSGLPPL